MFYINPKEQTKEQWLTENATRVGRDEVEQFNFEKMPEYFPVVWVDNGDFSAAGVAPDLAERDRWFAESDLRPKAYFLVKREVFYDLHPEYQEVVEEAAALAASSEPAPAPTLKELLLDWYAASKAVGLSEPGSAKRLNTAKQALLDYAAELVGGKNG